MGTENLYPRMFAVSCTCAAIMPLITITACTDPVSSGIGAGALMEGIDRTEDALNSVVMGGTSSALSVSDVTARNLMLIIQSFRGELSAETDKVLGALDQQKVDALNSIKDIADNIEQGAASIDDTRELITIDMNETFERFGFISPKYRLIRVDGAAQFHKMSGYYIVLVKAGPLEFDGRKLEVDINGQKLNEEFYGMSKNRELLIRIPVDIIENDFNDEDVRVGRLSLKIEIPKEKPAWKIWEKSGGFTNVRFDIPIHLFPRYPIDYRFVEANNKDEVDRTRIEWANSRTSNSFVGCGKSKCHAYHNAYADIPAGGEAIGLVRNCSWYLLGWGGLLANRKPPKGYKHPEALKEEIGTGPCGSDGKVYYATSFSPGLVSLRFHQHAHNVTRTVRFQAAYHPRKTIQKYRLVKLVPYELTTEKSEEQIAKEKMEKVTGVDPGKLSSGQIAAVTASIVADIHKVAALAEPVVHVSDISQNVDARFVPASATVVQTMPLDACETMPTNGSVVDNDEDSVFGAPIGRLRYGQTYMAQLSPGAKYWTFIGKDFLGNMITVSPAKRDTRMRVDTLSQVSPQRVELTPIPPWERAVRPVE